MPIIQIEKNGGSLFKDVQKKIHCQHNQVFQSKFHGNMTFDLTVNNTLKALKAHGNLRIVTVTVY